MPLAKRCSALSLLLHLVTSPVTVSANAPGTSAAPIGPYAIKSQSFSDSRFDWSDTTIDVVYPVGEANQTFPLIVYAHGFGATAYEHYHSLFDTMASWGYVIVAPKTCRYGCLTWWNCHSLEGDPKCFGDYYKMQLAAIDWAREGSAKLPINFALGVGIAGHSMGGQATLFSAAKAAASHDIRTAVMHHAYTHTYPAVRDIPYLAFTGTNDTLAPPMMTDSFFNAEGSYPERGLVNRIGEGHSAASEWGDGEYYNPMLAWYTVAWFKVHLDKTPVANGVDFEELVYGSSANSLCHGGDQAMRKCTLLRQASATNSKVVLV